MPDYGYVDSPYNGGTDPISGLGNTLQDGDVGRRMLLLTRTFPDLGSDPAAALQYATAQTSDADMLNMATSHYTLAQVAQKADDLKQQPDVVQRASYANLTDKYRELLRQVGYSGPPDKQADGGGWTVGIAGHDLFDIGSGGGGPLEAPIHAAGWVLSSSADALAHVTGPALDGLSASADFVPHLFRLRNDQADKGEGLTGLFSPGSWIDAWNETSDGNHYYSEDSLKRARDVLGGGKDDELMLAKEAAAGGDLNTVLDKAARAWGFDPDKDPTGYHTAVIKAYESLSDNNVQDAITALANGHVTMGRTLARSFGLTDFSDRLGPASIVSGTFDAAAAWFLDPLVLGGKIREGLTAARYGLGTASEALDNLHRAAEAAKVVGTDGEAALKLTDMERSSAQQFKTFAQGFADAYSQPTEAGRGRAFINRPKFTIAFTPFTKWLADSRGVVDTNRVLDFYGSITDPEGLDALASMGRGHHAQYLIPHISDTDRAALWVKDFVRKPIDWMADAGVERRQAAHAASPEGLAGAPFIDDSLRARVSQNIDDPTQLFLDNVAAPFGRAVRNFMTYGPRGGHTLLLSGEDSVNEMARFAQSLQVAGATRAETDAFFGRMLGDINPVTGQITQSVGSRQIVAMNIIRSMMERTGLLGDEAVTDRFLNRLGQQYGVATQIDPSMVSNFRTGDLAHTQALFFNQTANAMSIPSPMEWIQATREQSMTKLLFGNYTRYVDPKMTKYWKPIVLMRTAFIPRIAGEEMLRGMVSRGPANMLGNLWAQYGFAWNPLRDDEGNILYRGDGTVTGWTPKYARASQISYDDEGNAVNRVFSEPSWKAAVVDPQLLPGNASIPAASYESMLWRPLSWFTQSLQGWASSAREVNGELLDDVSKHPWLAARMEPINDLATRWAVANGRVFGDLTDKTGMGLTRRDMVVRLVGPQAIENRRLLLESKMGQDAMAHKLGITLLAKDDIHMGNRGVVQTLGTDLGQPPVGRENMVDIGTRKVRLDTSTRGPAGVGEDPDGYYNALFTSLGSMEHDPVAHAEMHQLAHYVSPDQRDVLATVAHDIGVTEAEDPLDAVRALKRMFDRMDGDTRTLLEDYMSNPSAENLDALKTTANVIGGTTLPSVVAAIEHPATDADHIGFLMHQHVNPTHLTDNLAEIRSRMARAGADVMQTAEGQKLAQDMSAVATNPVTGEITANALGPGQRAMYAPMLDRDGMDRWAQLMNDPSARRGIENRLRAHLRSEGLNQADIDHAVNALMSPDVGHLAAGQEGYQARTGGLWEPMSTWVTPNHRIAQSVTDHLAAEAGAEKSTIGKVALLDKEVRKAKLGDATNVHVSLDDSVNPSIARPQDGQVPALSWRLEGDNVARIDPLEPQHSTTYYFHGGVWKSLAELPAGIDVDKLPQQVSAGIPYIDAVHRLADVQSNEILNALSGISRATPGTVPTDADVAHAVLEPIVGRPRPAPLTQSGGTGWQSRFNLDTLWRTHPSRLPNNVWAPPRLLSSETRWGALMRWWFDGPVGAGLRTLSRSPMMAEAYGEAYRRLGPMFEKIYRPAELMDRVNPLLDRLGLDTDAERRTFIRFWDELPNHVRDPRANHLSVNESLDTVLNHLPPKPVPVTDARDAYRALGTLTPQQYRDAAAEEAQRGGTTLIDRAAARAAVHAENVSNAQAMTDWATRAQEVGLKGDEIATLRQWARNEYQLHYMTDEAASHQAIQDILPYVHDPEMRSNFQSYVGTLVPFWFAQEQFLKRWAKTIYEAPESMRRLQMLHNGIRNVGFVQRDPNTGEEIFVYPGTEQTTALLANGLNKLSGGTFDFRLPLYSAMTGTTQFVVPGFSDLGAPSLGPVAGIGMKFLHHIFPELDSENSVLGDRARDDWMDYIVPSQFRNLWRGIRGDMSDPTFAREVSQQVLYTFAHGKFPAETAELSSLDRDNLLAQIREGARGTFLMKGALGLLSPIAGGTPQTNYLDTLNAEIKTLFSLGLDPSEAYDAFRKRHGNDLPAHAVLAAYEVQPTDRKSGAVLPQTQAAYDFVNQHQDLMTGYPYGAPWLLPPSASTDVRQRLAYNQQLSLQMRTLKSPDELMRQLYFQEGADEYFAVEAQKNAILKGLPADDPQALARLQPWLESNPGMVLDSHNTNVRKAVQDAWSLYSKSFQSMHPVFASELNSTVAKDRRASVRTELGQLLNDPVDTAKVDHADELKHVLDEWQTFDDAYQGLRFSSTNVVQQRRKAMINQFSAAMDLYLHDHPRVLSFFNSVIKPDLPS